MPRAAGVRRRPRHAPAPAPTADAHHLTPRPASPRRCPADVADGRGAWRTRPARRSRAGATGDGRAQARAGAAPHGRLRAREGRQARARRAEAHGARDRPHHPAAGGAIGGAMGRGQGGARRWTGSALVAEPRRCSAIDPDLPERGRGDRPLVPASPRQGWRWPTGPGTAPSLEHTTVLVGPEGGWDDAEASARRGHRWPSAGTCSGRRPRR